MNERLAVLTEIKLFGFRRWLAGLVFRLIAPRDYGATEIRPNQGAEIDGMGRCENTDEVVGFGHLHVEQMDKNVFWARLSVPEAKGRDVVMWFNSKTPITLIAEPD